MSWALIDDRMHGHPKVRKLQRIPFAGAEALGFWAWCLSWCRAYAPTTAKVSVDVIADAWHAEEDHIVDVMELLVRVGLMDREASHLGEYIIHDWREWQYHGLAQQVKAGKARAANAERVGGRFTSQSQRNEHDPPASHQRARKAGASGASPLHTSTLGRGSGEVVVGAGGRERRSDQ